MNRISYFLLLITSLTLTGWEWSNSQFISYKELIAGTDIAISMTAIEGGTYDMGNSRSPVSRSVKIDPFWIGTYEITWDQYEIFMHREHENKSSPLGNEVSLNVDAVSGATTPI